MADKARIALQLVRETRECRKCGLTKPIEDFHGDGKPRRDGSRRRRRDCRVCCAERSARSYAKNREERKDYERAKRRANREKYKERDKTRYLQRKQDNPVTLLLNRLRSRAKQRGILFALTPTDVFMPSHCPILGIVLQPLGMADSSRDDAASLDRLVPHLGYVPGNVEVISFRANRIKNDGTADEHERIAAWMRAKGVR